jgi:hypothetical protein
VSFHDKEDGNVHVFPWFVSASVGFWNVPGRTCDVSSAGALALRIIGQDVPPLLAPNVGYSVVGFDDGFERFAGVEMPATGFPGVSLPITDAPAFARRGYNCVVGVRLETPAEGADQIAGPFCMSPSGTVGCDRVGPAPIGIRWISPQDGQTVAGFLHEGPGNCLAESSGPVVRTENWVDGAFHDAQANLPWGCEIDTTTLPDGPHTLTVKAFAPDGRSVEHSITIRVVNRSGGTTPPTGAPGPSSPTQPGPSSPGTVTAPAGGSPAGGAPGTGPEDTTDDTTARRPLTIARARVLGRRALAKRYGRAFKQRTGYRLTCKPPGACRVSCRVRWRYRRWSYRGSVQIRRTPSGDTAVVHVNRRRTPGQPRTA